MTSTTSTAPSSTPSNHTAPANDGRTTTIVIVLSIIGLIIVGMIIYMTWRMKRRRLANDTENLASSATQGTRLDRGHPAARITPFGSPEGEVPRFTHTPGADMRIAIRRPDGAWNFSDSRSSFSPSGVGEIDVVPSPSSSTTTLPLMSARKEREAKASRLAYERDHDPELNPPPPAYGNEHGGYIDHAKK